MLNAMIREALGPIPALLDDTSITDIFTNPDGFIWVKRWGKPEERSTHHMSAEKRRVCIKLLARAVNQFVDDTHPIVYGKIPWNGARFTGQLPPITHEPVFTIRSHHHQAEVSLQDYIDEGILMQAEAEALERAIRTEKNIVISGETGAGKTTLLIALLGLLRDDSTRVITIEDTEELKCKMQNWTGFYTSKDVSAQDLLHATLRSFPRRIVFGEVREGPVCYEMLQAWLTGHRGGMVTIHADSVRNTFTRIEELCREYIKAVPYECIASSIDMIVHLHAYKTHVEATGVAWVGAWSHEHGYAIKYVSDRPQHREVA